MAQQNAQKCADQLAANGAGAGAITTQQYCEKPENVSQQLCVCQKNNMAQGCPGAIAAGTSSPGSSNDQGANIQAMRGNAAFGGGFKAAGAPQSVFGASGAGAKAANGLAAGGDSSGLGGNDGTSGTTTGSGGASGSAGLATPSGSDVAAGKATAAAEKKKWSFGAFSGLGGGLSSYFGGSDNKNNNLKSGALNTKEAEAIKRQIASERLSEEVSSASGKSNWEKVRSMYLLKENSFILGQ